MDADDKGVGDQRSPSEEFWSEHADNPITTKPPVISWPCVDDEIEANPKGYEFKETADLTVSVPSSSKGDGPLNLEVSVLSSSKGDGQLDPEDILKGHPLIDILSDKYFPNSDDTDPAAGVGLENLGSTCYMNSVLQCLVHTVPLFMGIIASDTGDSWRCTRIENPYGLCLVCNLRRLFQMSTMGKGYVWPLKLVQNLSYFSKSFRRHQQDDAHEFLTAIRTRLTECRKEPPDSDENFIRKLFCARAVSTLTCKGCGHSSSREEDLFDMGLPIDEWDNLSMALQSYMEGEVEYNCESCGAAAGAKQKTEVNRFPPIVTFLLKRFNAEGNKVEKDVSFTMELDLVDYAVRRLRGGHKYVLYAIIVHEGERANSGHYLSFARLSANEWSRFNDKLVSRVSEEEVLSQKKAYILFYVKKGTAWFSEAIVPFERRNHGMFLPF